MFSALQSTRDGTRAEDGLLPAAILDFRARLGNRRSTIVATTMNGPPATAVATTRSVSDPIFRYRKEE